jgi:hypothetical protein
VPDPNQVRVIDSNLSAVTAEADKVVWIGGPEQVIVHTEFLSGRDKALPQRIHWYNTLVAHHHDLPVWTIDEDALDVHRDLDGIALSARASRGADQGSREHGLGHSWD